MVEPADLTDSQVRRAGKHIRYFLRGDMDHNDPRIGQAVEVAQAFRRLHQSPLAKANMGVRSVLQTTGCPVEVSQRMKRWPTIIDKLEREPQLPLSKMQDIGGCRAILNSVEDIRRVEARLKKNRPVTGYSDYITTPRSSGYRGVHVVVLYDDAFGKQRQIEIQLRTWAMHEWAITVERLASRVGAHLKGDGSHEIQLLMASISEAMALEEADHVVPEGLQLEIQQRRIAADPYLKGTA